MPKKNIALKYAVRFFIYLFLVWGVYRFLLLKLPEDVEALFVKPIIWLVPVIYLLKKEKSKASTIGITGKGLFSSIYLVLFLGFIFALEGFLLNTIKYQWIDFGANIGGEFYGVMLASIATAISEEIAFRGYIFTRLQHALGGVWVPNIISSSLWSLVHLPVTILWWPFDPLSSVAYLFLTFLFGIGSAFIFSRTKNIAAPILLHFLWEWPIILFR